MPRHGAWTLHTWLIPREAYVRVETQAVEHPWSRDADRGRHLASQDGNLEREAKPKVWPQYTKLSSESRSRRAPKGVDGLLRPLAGCPSDGRRHAVTVFLLLSDRVPRRR